MMKLSEDDLNFALAENMSTTEAAFHFQTSRTSVARAEEKHNIKLPRKHAKQQIIDFRKVVEDMPPLDAVEFLLNTVELLLTSSQDDTPEWVNAVTQGTRQRMLLLLLNENLGKVVTKEFLMARLYADKSIDEVPQDKIIDVFVCKLRTAMGRANVSYTIDTIWGRGFRLSKLAPEQTNAGA
jgi:DNA-binding winged helix-turn-helix (wHTH) protein